MQNFISVDKMSKKARKEYYAAGRVMIGFNTGTRAMKSKKYLSRAASKAQMMRDEF